MRSGRQPSAIEEIRNENSVDSVQNADRTVEPKMTQKTTVIVWDKPYEISVYQKSKTVWIAVGEYMGGRIETKGSSQSAAAAHWREAARYKGN